MDELQYFAANAPERVVQRTGHLTTAAVILLLAALPLGYLVLIAGNDIVRSAMRGREISSELVFWLMTVVVVAYLFVAGFGLVTRWRWSRPLVLIGMSTWLTFGSAYLCIALLFEVRERYQYGFQYFDGSRFFELMVELSFAFAFSVAVPWFVQWLVRPEFVRSTLEYFDPVPRRSDRWSVRRSSVAITFFFMSAAVTAFYFASKTSNWWAIDLTPSKTIAMIAGFLFVSGVALCTDRKIGRHVATAFAVSAFVLLLMIGTTGGKRRPFNFSDSSGMIGFLLAVDAVCCLRIRREGVRPNEEPI